MAIYTTFVNPNLLNNRQYAKPIPDNAPINFFINSKSPFSTPDDPAFGNLRLSVFDGVGTEVISDAATLNQLVFTGGYRIYVENMQITGLSYGETYKLVIYDTTNDEQFLDLGCFTFVEATSRYTEVSYRNSSDIFNFSYEALPTYRNIVFLDLAEIDNQNEYDLEQYSEASTAIIRNQKSQTKNYSVLQCEAFDLDAHEGAKGLSLHDDILINGNAYSVKEGWQVDTDVRTNKTKGSMEVYDIERNEINLNI
jgi:hypothetical protein